MLRRTRDTASETRRARDAAVAEANRWAAARPRADLAATQQALDVRAAEINDASGGVGVAVMRIGQRLHAPPGLRLR
jgi:hypothetical protein